jgi:hypothetical protein
MKTISKITIVLAIAGLVCLVIGFAIGGNKQLRTMYENHDLSMGWGVEYHDVKEEFSDINSLDISIDAMSVTIKEYEGTTCKVEGNIRTTVDVEKHGNTLTVKEEEWLFFAINWSLGNENLTIYLPKDISLERASFDVDAGSVDVEGILNVDSSEINVDAGNFYADDIVCKNVTVDVSAGKVEIGLLDAQDSEFDVDAGKIVATVVGTNDDYRYNAESDAGNITIGDYESSGISDEDRGGNGDRQIEASCDAGSITLRMRGE